MEINIFVSYSHRDHKFIDKEELLGFLLGLERDGDIRFWVDKQLTGGDRWDDEIRAQIAKAHIALVLVSQAFLDSVYCMDIEIAGFLERRRKEGLRVFPVVLSACEWDRHAWLAEHQALPGGEETIEEHYGESGPRKRLYLRIRKELRALVEDIRLQQDVDEEPGGAEALTERRRVTLLNCALSIDAFDEPIDPEDKLELLYEVMPQFRERCTAQIQAFEGHMVNVNSSGGCLACFGYPTAYEDSSLRAVRAGLGMVEAMQLLSEQFGANLGVRLSARVGIQSGLVISSTGAEANDELQHGDTHSMALLLQEHAPLNSVVIGDATYRLVRNFFATSAEVEIDRPGLRGKVPGWRILEDLGMRSRFDAERIQGLAKLVGREAEVRLILEAWQKAVNGHGGFVFVSAEAGIGKSRLLEEIKRSTLSDPHYLIECQCSALHQNSTLFPIIRSIESWLGLFPEDSPETKLKKLEAAIDATLLEREQIVPYLAELLSLPLAAETNPEHRSGKQHKEHMFEALLLLLFQRSVQTPVLFIIEDLHWMDPTTEELLGILMDELPGLSTLLVCTARPEYHAPGAWIARDHFLPVKLSPLSRSQIREMVSRITGDKALPLEVLKAIADKTEGYPLFVEDLTRMVIESDMLIEQDGVYVLRKPMQSLAIPDTLQETLMARLVHADSARLVAQLGAVIGREFSQEMIQTLYPLDETTLKEALGLLIATGLLYRRGLMSRAIYVFKHALVQDALYQSLLKRERKVYHNKFAQVLEERFPSLGKTQPELLARHFQAAGNPEAAAKYWIAACEIATRDSANLEAVSHAGKALEAIKSITYLQERDKLELHVQILQGPALLAVRGWSSPDLAAAFARAKELCGKIGEKRQLFKITRGLWTYHMVSAQLSESIVLADELMCIAEAEHNEDYRIQAHAAYCDSYFWMGRPALSAKYALLGLELYDLEQHHTRHALEYGEDPAAIFLCYGALSLWLLGEENQAEKLAAQAITNMDLFTHHFSRCFLLNGLAWYSEHTGNTALARHYGERLKNLSADHDFSQWLALAKMHCGWAIANEGETDKGVVEMLEGMAELRAGGVSVVYLHCYYLLASTVAEAGRRFDALEFTNQGLEHAGSTQNRYCLPELHRLKAELLKMIDGTSEEIEKHYQSALSIAQEQQAVSYIRKLAYET